MAVKYNWLVIITIPNIQLNTSATMGQNATILLRAAIAIQLVSLKIRIVRRVYEIVVKGLTHVLVDCSTFWSLHVHLRHAKHHSKPNTTQQFTSSQLLALFTSDNNILKLAFGKYLMLLSYEKLPQF